MIKIVFLTRTGCGICVLMAGTNNRLKALTPDYSHERFHITTQAEGRFYNTKFGITEAPAWLVFDNGTYIGSVQGGQRIKTLLHKIGEMIEL